MIVAVLAEPRGFDPGTRQTARAGDGIEVVKMRRADSLTVEGVAYEFAAHTQEQAEAWLAEHGIKALRFGDGEDVEFEVLAAGTFNAQRGGRVTITPEQLAQIATVSNALIDAGKLRPPLKLGHGEDQDKVRAMFPEGGEPALGWVRKLAVRGEKLIACATQVPRRFLDAIKAGAWRTRSAEILPKWTDGEGNAHEMVFRGVAWLGAQTPAVPNLADLVGLSAEEMASITIEFSDVNEGQHEPGSPVDGAAKDGNEPEGVAGAAPDKTDETEKETLEMAENAALQAELDAAKAREKAAREELVGLKLAEAVRDRRITPAQVEGEKAIALAQADPGAYLATIFARPQMADLTKPLANGAGDPAQVSAKKGEARLIELAEQIAKEKGVPYPQALCLAADAEPEAYAVYYNEAHPLRASAKEA